MAVYKPIAEAYKVAFTAMYTDFRGNAMSARPIFAIANIIKNQAMGIPVSAIRGGMCMALPLKHWYNHSNPQ